MNVKRGAIATGTTMAALALRDAIKSYMKKPVLTKKTGKPRRTRKGRLPKRRIAIAKKTITENLSMENTTRRLTTSGQRFSIPKLLSSIMDSNYYRVQGLSQYDTSVGFYPISNRTQSGTGIKYLPVHVWDLSSIPNEIAGTSTNPVVGAVLTRASAASDADAGYIQLASQGANGVMAFANGWSSENTISGTAGVSSPNPMRKAFHQWSHLKMNLYGVRKRATKYIVSLIRLTHRGSDFFYAADTNRDKKKLYDYLSRPLMYSNLNSGDPLTSRMFKIIKSYTVIIDPISLDDYGADTATPHMHTINWFIKHNKTRRFDWYQGVDAGAGTDAAFDVEQDSTQNRTSPETRMYLLVQALSPEATTVVDSFTVPDPIKEPSYDCVIRNKWLINTP